MHCNNDVFIFHFAPSLPVWNVLNNFEISSAAIILNTLQTPIKARAKFNANYSLLTVIITVKVNNLIMTFIHNQTVKTKCEHLFTCLVIHLDDY